MLLTVNEQRNILHEIRKREANWIGHILRRNCLLKQFIEGKIKGEMEVTRRRGRRRKKLLDDLKARRGYWINDEWMNERKVSPSLKWIGCQNHISTTFRKYRLDFKTFIWCHSIRIRDRNRKILKLNKKYKIRNLARYLEKAKFKWIKTKGEREKCAVCVNWLWPGTVTTRC